MHHVSCISLRCLGFHISVYYVFLKEQQRILKTGASKNISSYDLFVVHRGFECAMFPHLYPTGDFTDTGILQHYQAVHGDNTSRVASIGLSWTRKCLSGVRAYGEHRDLSFFLYERHLAAKYFHAQVNFVYRYIYIYIYIICIIFIYIYISTYI
jgi:hypothetical protein